MPYDSARRQRAVYSRSARLYDLSTGLAGFVYGFSDGVERRTAVARLMLEPGQRVLEVGVGTGANLGFIAEMVGPGGTIAGVDVTRAMLRMCARRLKREGISALLIEGDAAHLPFSDHEFDAALIFGSFNGLDDREAALGEMMRVAKPAAKIVIADEGMSERKRDTFLGKLFSWQDPWLKVHPPLDLLPTGVTDAHLTHFRAENWYLIDFSNVLGV